MSFYNEDKLKPEDVTIGTEIVESCRGFCFNGYKFGKVVRETRTQWITDLGSRYRKEDLRVIGSDRYGRMELKTDKHVKTQEKFELTNKVKNVLYDLGNKKYQTKELTTEQLKTVLVKGLEIINIIAPPKDNNDIIGS